MVTLEEKRRTIVSAQVEAAWRDGLDRLAREGDRTLSAEVRRAIARHLAGVSVRPKPWWQTHPRAHWSAADWAEARRLGVVPPPLPSLDLDPTERLLGDQARAGGMVSWGPPASPADTRRRKADLALEKAGQRPRRW